MGMPGGGIPVVRLHYSADPTMTPEKVADLRARYTSEARFRRECEIQYEALEGELLYPQFNRERNIVQPFDVSDPDYWTIWMGLDPHPRTAHGLVWEAFNKHGDQLVIGELWPEIGTRYGASDGGRWSTRDYAEAIKFFEGDSMTKPSPFRWARGKKLHVGGRRFMDTFGKAANSGATDAAVQDENFFETYQRLGNELKVNLAFQSALKGHENLAKAQDTIARKLNPSDGGGPPIMRVFADCYETIDEFENVRFPEGTPERPADERPITYQKHCLDCIHYIETARPGHILRRRMVSQPPSNAPGAR